MRAIVLGVIVAIAACGGAASVRAPTSEGETPISAYRLSQAQPPRVYESENGVVLTMVFLAREEGAAERKALAHFVGIEHALAAKVFVVVNRKSRGNEASDLWETMFDGQYWPVMEVDHKTHRVEFFAPDSWAKMKVVFDSDASAAIDSDKLLAQHEKDKESLKLLASFDREFHKGIVEKRGGKLAKALEIACGAEIPLHYAWDSYSDALLRKPEVCARGLQLLTQLCSSSSNAGETVVRKIKTIRCEMGKQASTSLDSAQGVLTIVASGTSGRVLDAKKKLARQIGIRRTVLRDSAGEYLVLNSLGMETTPVFWGKGSKLRELRAHGDGNDLLELGGGAKSTPIIRRSDHWELVCQKKSRRFKELSREESDKVLDNADFGEPIWKRREVALARDTNGVYYFVDRASDRYGGKDYRVYRGLRGQMVQTKLYDIVDDAKGKVFSTDKGNLRLIISKTERGAAFWLQGKKREALTVIKNYEAGYMQLIYRELGVYDGKELGLICP